MKKPRYIIFSGVNRQEEYEAWDKEALRKFKLKNPTNRGTRWAKAIEHPTNDQLAVLIDTQHRDIFPIGAKEELTRTELKSLGWYAREKEEETVPLTTAEQLAIATGAAILIGGVIYYFS